MVLTTELRALGREGRSGAVEVVAVADVAVGLAAEAEVGVIADEVAGLLAVGVVDKEFPAMRVN